MSELNLSAAAAFHMTPEPVVCCRKQRIVYRNPAFAGSFPQLREGDLLPEDWGCTAPPCSGVIPGWSLLGWAWEEGMILRLNRLSPPSPLPERWLSLLSQRLRQPLASMAMAQDITEAQLSPFLQKGCEEGFSRLTKARMQLMRLCRELELVDSQESPFDFSPQVADLDGLCRDTVAQLEAVLKLSGTSLIYRGSSQNLFACCDDLLVQTLICHLVSNSVKQQPAGAHLELHLDQRGKMAHISLLDDGPGMTPRQIASLFAPSQEEIPEDSVLNHLGLGLMVCRRIALLHQGGLLLSSRPGGQGLIATFSLPLFDPGSTESLQSERRLDASGGVPLVLRELSVILPEQCYRTEEL